MDGVDIPSSSKLLTPVYYRPSQFQFPKRALLELTADNQVRVTIANPEGAGEVVVFASLLQVQRLRVFRGSQMRMRINDQLYWMDVDTRSLRNIADSRYSGAKEWVSLLKENSIPASNFNMLAFSLIPIIILAVLQIVVIIIRFLLSN